MEYLLVGIGGFLGANIRYVVGRWIIQLWGSQFPWGTLVINVTGSFLLGVFMASLNSQPLASLPYRLFFAVGFLGAYTTFSTFSYETLLLVQNQNIGAALLNIGGSVVLGLVGISLGVFFGGLFAK